MTRKLHFVISFLLLFSMLQAQELPRADFENTFYMLPIFEKIRVPGMLSYEEKEEQLLKMKMELGEGNLYHRLGFSFIYGPSVDQPVRDACKIMEENGLHAGLIFALQSHTRNDFRAIANQDLRHYQWRMDGVDWKGAYTSSGTLEIPENERDYKVPTPSRYASRLRNYNAKKASDWAEYALRLMDDFPGVIACINGPIEEELAIGGHDNSAKLADYSPYAITEFRDWLRHAGMYDDTDGRYAGEGASSLIIGELVDFNGILRSQFYDDPTPDKSHGTGLSFNEYFGTEFSSWSLKYWDLQIYPDPITNEDFECTPESGDGYSEGGFDAPRILFSKNKYWRAWSYDIPDQGGNYPIGNPDHPAYGFRQVMVRNFVRDLFDVLAETGIPRHMMFAHQIPGEALGNFTGQAGRNRSSASTIWTGYLEKSETVGITRFGDIDPDLVTQYAGDWGIFEWHTLPNPHLRLDDLYSTSKAHLNKFYANQCHILFPGWWDTNPPASDETFPLNDSDFGRAIGEFMSSRVPVPYKNQHDAVDYSPSMVNGVVAEVLDQELEINWEKKIWPDLVAQWQEWDSLSHFEVQLSKDGMNWDIADTTSATGMALSKTDTIYKVRVRALTLSGLTGPWSVLTSSFLDTMGARLILEAEYDSLYADPGMTNRISISLDDPSQVIDLDSLIVTLFGTGSNQNTLPAELDSIELFWPMNSMSEVQGYHHLDDIQISGGILTGTVSNEEPIDPYFYFSGSELNGEELPYITFRLYSSLETTGNVYWFTDDGHRSTSYEMQKGWNIYRLDSLAEWVSFQKINQVRLDPGTTASARIMLDWFAISSKPFSEGLLGEITTGDQKLSILTSPTADSGSYTVKVEYGSQVDSITIHTHTTNRAAQINLLSPLKDSLMESGNTLELRAEAVDPDGRIEEVFFLLNDSAYETPVQPPYLFEWSPAPGVYELVAAAIDNGEDTVFTEPIQIEVFSQENVSGNPFPIPGIIEAEDYDLGGALVAFEDSDPENLGTVYRNDAVDIGSLSGESSGYYVGWTNEGEWLEYTMDVAESQKVEVFVMVASESGGGEFLMEVDDTSVSNHMLIHATGGDQVYDTIRIEDLYMHRGIHKLKIKIIHGGFNLDQIEIKAYDLFILGTPEFYTDLSIYPNPATSSIRVKLPEGLHREIEIWSVNGKLHKKMQVAAAEEIWIPVGDLPEGIYILNLISEKQLYRVKFIKQ